MRLTCPCCGATLSLEALLNDTAARRAVAAALVLPAGLGGRLLRYLGLFRPPQRSLTWDRAAKLLDELNAMIAAGQIERNGRSWSAPHDYWQIALDDILERRNLDLPLKSHGYLLEIIAGMGNKAEARTEVENEQRRRAERRAGSPHGLQPVAAWLAAPLPPEGPGVMAQPAPAAQQPRRRVPPPPEFRALADRLRGKFSPADPPAPPTEELDPTC